MIRSLLILVFASVVLSAGLAAGGPIRSGRRPSVTAAVDRPAIKLGESATVSYACGGGATSCQRDITVWEPRTDGVILPLVGKYTVTPKEAGTFTTTVTAFKRRRDLNGDGRADGPRRSTTISVTVTVEK